MLSLVLISAYLIVLTIATATARGGPIQMTERGSSTLVWLAKNRKPGTPRSRASLARRSQQRIWRGLRLAGVYDGFMCIHRHESIDWHIHNPPYDGGMQEDRGFQLTYGAEFDRLWGLANAWPPWAQLMAAFRAYHGYHQYRPRGYHPWPNTARYCGLL